MSRRTMPITCCRCRSCVKARRLALVSHSLKAEPLSVYQTALSRFETRDMSKKQLLALAFLAAIPATGLLIKMLFSLGYLLADQSSAGAVVWIIFVVCLLGSVFFAALPLLLWLYYPAAGFEGAVATAGAGAFSNPVAALGGKAPAIGDDVDDDNADYEEDGEADYEEMDDEAAADDGEAYFEEDALDEDLDEFDGGFDDDDDK